VPQPLGRVVVTGVGHCEVKGFAVVDSRYARGCLQLTTSAIEPAGASAVRPDVA